MFRLDDHLRNYYIAKIIKIINMRYLFKLYLGSLNIKSSVALFLTQTSSSIDSEGKYRCDFRIKISRVLICKEVLIDLIGFFLMAITGQ